MNAALLPPHVPLPGHVRGPPAPGQADRLARDLPHPAPHSGHPLPSEPPVPASTTPLSVHPIIHPQASSHPHFVPHSLSWCHQSPPLEAWVWRGRGSGGVDGGENRFASPAETHVAIGSPGEANPPDQKRVGSAASRPRPASGHEQGHDLQRSLWSVVSGLQPVGWPPWAWRAAVPPPPPI